MRRFSRNCMRRWRVPVNLITILSPVTIEARDTTLQLPSNPDLVIILLVVLTETTDIMVTSNNNNSRGLVGKVWDCLVMLHLLTQAEDILLDLIPGVDTVPLVPDTGDTLIMFHPGNTDIPVFPHLVLGVPGTMVVVLG